VAPGSAPGHSERWMDIGASWARAGCKGRSVGKAGPGLRHKTTHPNTEGYEQSDYRPGPAVVSWPCAGWDPAIWETAHRTCSIAEEPRAGDCLPSLPSRLPVYSLISLPAIAQDRSRPQSGAQVEIPLHTYFSCGPLPPATQAIWWFLSSGTSRKVLS